MIRPLAILTASVLGGGCGFEAVTCLDLVEDIERCDLRPANLRCDAISIDERSDLHHQLQFEGCAGLWSAAEDQHVDDRACRLFGWDCPERLGDMPAPRPTQNPIVFVGGIDSDAAFDWNPALLSAIAEGSGSEVLHVSLPAWKPRAARTEALWQALQEHSIGRWTGQFNLVCYAVGGLDCRYLVSPGGLFAAQPTLQSETADMVASITTIATPHQGTEVANAALFASEDVLNTLLGGRTEIDRNTQLSESLQGLTPAALYDFNGTVIDADQVHYQSWAGVSHLRSHGWGIDTDSAVNRACGQGTDGLLGPDAMQYRDAMSEPLWSTAPFASRTFDAGGTPAVAPSDGMVSVDSARWADFRGCLPADHYDVVGQFFDLGPDPDTGFDTRRFYLNLAAELAAKGF